MLSNTKLAECAAYFLLLNRNEIHGYYCKNDVQELNRLSCFYENYEVQINEITHSNVMHYHDANMCSLILWNSYTWFLRQDGANAELELLAPQGAIIRMGPRDLHRIPKNENGLKSISLCVFDKKTDWHEYYPVIEKHQLDRIYWVAVSQLRSWLYRPKIHCSAT